METRRLDHFATLLRQERARIKELLQEIDVASASATTADGTLPPGEEAESGASGAGPEDDAAIVARESAALREIDEALRLLYDAPRMYGVCRICNERIATERLELLPATRLCARHADGRHYVSARVEEVRHAP